MATDVYERLAQHLDDMPAGYPSTESGVEMRILRRLFTPEDAELTLYLTLIAEEPRVIARRAKLPAERRASSTASTPRASRPGTRPSSSSWASGRAR
jgi:hypothetical protein